MENKLPCRPIEESEIHKCKLSQPFQQISNQRFLQMYHRVCKSSRFFIDCSVLYNFWYLNMKYPLALKGHICISKPDHAPVQQVKPIKCRLQRTLPYLQGISQRPAAPPCPALLPPSYQRHVHVHIRDVSDKPESKRSNKTRDERWPPETVNI